MAYQDRVAMYEYRWNVRCRSVRAPRKHVVSELGASEQPCGDCIIGNAQPVSPDELADDAQSREHEVPVRCAFED